MAAKPSLFYLSSLEGETCLQLARLGFGLLPSSPHLPTVEFDGISN